MDYINYFNSLKNKKVAVVGVGISNTPLIKMLVDFGIKVTALDKNPNKLNLIKELNDLGVETFFGEDYLEHISHDVVFRSPGIRDDIPQLLKANEMGSEITSEMEVFIKLCPCEIFAVTGSDGKTTTTTLIYELLKKQGYNCHLGGNIGKPLLPEIGNIKKSDKVILELSSFQLKTINKSPHVAVITNLSPNHLDWHKDMAEYLECKKNLYKFQNNSDLFVTNLDNEITAEIFGEAKGFVRLFSRKNKNADIYADTNSIYFKNEKIIDKKDILLPGEHNVENYMAAIGAVKDYVSVENIVFVAKTFAKIPHRIEFIRELNGVSYYNDSIASSPTRAIAGLNSFDRKVIMIAGGYDKNLDYTCLGDVICKKVKKLVLIGATSEKIYNAVLNCEEYKMQMPEIVNAVSFENALTLAKKDAQKGDKIILCPASASFDMFENFEQRGNLFKKLVNELTE